jgi:hypothetical protein
MICKQCHALITEDGCLRCIKWADELTYWKDIFTSKKGNDTMKEEKMKELETTIDELRGYITNLSNDLDALYGEVEPMFALGAAIKEIQEVLEKNGHWIIKKVG